MALELIGRLIKTLPVQSGTSARGAWSKQDFVIETLDQYPRKVCVSAWGERINGLAGANEGDILKINFTVESREFNERWYTDVRAWNIEKQGTSTSTSSQVQAVGNTPPPPLPNDDPFAGDTQQDVDDLPF
jgi:hypothetical protein